MDWLQNILDTSNLPLISALILGLMTAISPCPLATNLTATAYISKNVKDKKLVFLSGLVYSLGRAFSYTLIGIALFLGVGKFEVALFFQQNGEKYIGPLLVLIGLVMLNIIKLPTSGKWSFEEKFGELLKGKGLWGAFLLGVLFALAFCPYSGALYFGVLIPMTISSAEGLYLPIVFALGTGLPVIVFAYLLAFSISKVGVFYAKIQEIEKIMRLIAGVAFILSGLYFISIFTGILN